MFYNNNKNPKNDSLVIKLTFLITSQIFKHVKLT